MHHQSLIKYVAAALVCSAGALSSQDSLAGEKDTQLVSITPASQFGPANAKGSLGSARNSADSVQYMGCQSGFDGTNNWGQCDAKDSAGHTLSCYTTDSEYIATIRAMSSQTFVDFFASPSGDCIGFLLSNDSAEAVPLN